MTAWLTITSITGEHHEPTPRKGGSVTEPNEVIPEQTGAPEDLWVDDEEVAAMLTATDPDDTEKTPEEYEQQGWDAERGTPKTVEEAAALRPDTYIQEG